jgi:hypothetical protein
LPEPVYSGIRECVSVGVRGPVDIGLRTRVRNEEEVVSVTVGWVFVADILEVNPGDESVMQ